VRAQDPFGEWSDPVWVDQGGFDPSLSFDPDGRVYLSSTETLHFPLPDEIDLATPLLGDPAKRDRYHVW
jgi:alpha-N-arabinofuranosidase